MKWLFSLPKSLDALDLALIVIVYTSAILVISFWIQQKQIDALRHKVHDIQFVLTNHFDFIDHEK